MRRVKTLFIACAFALALAACGSAQKYDSEREWQRAECNKVIDPKDRERCMKRVEGR
jgi:hypothetical protein